MNARPYIFAACFCVIMTALGAPALLWTLQEMRSREDTLQKQIGRMQLVRTRTHDHDSAWRNLRDRFDARQLANVATPPDRLQVMELCQTLARQHGLGDIAFTMSPELSMTAPGSDLEIRQATITLQATAAHDSAIYDVARILQKQLPGKARITGFTLARTESPDGPGRIDTTLTFDTVWLGGMQEVAGNEP
ncbi:MAG: hypothetical protein GC131_04920 [Alphaproteobacteria bacterium]|nr:hypothetical protein [Alphaproteobacteria bacterium]